MFKVRNELKRNLELGNASLILKIETLPFCFLNCAKKASLEPEKLRKNNHLSSA
jgi:hypothetical protein